MDETLKELKKQTQLLIDINDNLNAIYEKLREINCGI
jgi:hypothetical protein